MRASALVAVLVGSLLSSTHASTPNTGFAAYIDVSNIQAVRTDGRADFTVRTSIEYAFTVPVNITRYSSPDDAVLLTIYTSAYDPDYDVPDGEAETSLYEEQINFDGGQITASTVTLFNLTTNSINDTVYDLRARLSSLGNFNGLNAEGSAVLAHNASSGSWVSATPAGFAAQQNEAAWADFNFQESVASQDFIDTSSETIYDDGPEMPDDGLSTGPSGNTSTTPGGNDKHSSTTPGGNDKHSSTSVWGDHQSSSSSTPCSTDKHKHEATPKPWMHDPEQPDPKPRIHHPHSKPKDSWDTAPCTTPTPTPTPDCSSSVALPSSSDSWGHVYARQASNQAVVALTLTFGPPSTPIPIRRLQVTAYGVPSDNGKPLKAVGKTSDTGKVNLRFKLGAGQTSVQVYRVYVSVISDRYRVATTNDNTATWLYYRLSSSPLAWLASGGETTTRSLRYNPGIKADIFHVHDRVLNSMIFANTTVATFKKEAAKLKAVWYPGDTSTEASYFSNLPQNPFISVRTESAQASTVIAHEFGHWFHFNARQQQAITYKTNAEAHTFCQWPLPNSPTVSFTEGYATAFGLTSLFGSRYQEGPGTGYCFQPYNTAPGALNDCQPIENYLCSAIPEANRSLSTDEGKVAAVLYDLVDKANDDNQGDPTLGKAGLGDTLSLPARTVFYSPVVANPQDMQTYWTNLKGLTALTQAQKNAAWSSFDFQYADFPQ